MENVCFWLMSGATPSRSVVESPPGVGKVGPFRSVVSKGFEN
mgnify:CR=1 FL=1